ncbi:hypothetical protein Misp04_43840 [Micromonospora sp. NBRC 101691]|nr:hypothetical protein Misp04_43840 [Micromonospora sp. NBRC 101691]
MTAATTSVSGIRSEPKASEAITLRTDATASTSNNGQNGSLRRGMMRPLKSGDPDRESPLTSM